MLVIAANSHDQVAVRLARNWQAEGAVLLTPQDLSAPGWCHYFPSGESRAAIGGRELAADEITGVFTRMPCVYEQELGHIVPGDRSYVASEMTAFLLAWLDRLRCPVVNRPTPGCLAGPNWRSEQWLRFAAGLGIPVQPRRRTVPRGPDETPDQTVCEVTVVGERCFGDAAPQLLDRARSLAHAAAVELLSVRFTGADAGSRLVSAHPWPDPESTEVAGALLDRLLGRQAC